MLWQAANADVNFSDLVKFRRTMHCKNRDHSRCQTTIGNNVDAGDPGVRIESKLFVDDVIVSAEIAKICLCVDGRDREMFVVPIVDARYYGVMATHQLERSLIVRCVDLS